MHLNSYFLELFDRATKRSDRAFCALPLEFQNTFLKKHFGPRDIPAHLIQSDQLAVAFIAAQLNVGPAFELPNVLQDLLEIRDPEELHQALSALNFDGARKLSKSLPYSSLVEKWRTKRQKARAMLESLTEDMMSQEVAHPFVTLRGPAFIVATELFVSHTNYHVGQFTQSMKHGGRAEAVPFPFGKIEVVVTAAA